MKQPRNSRKTLYPKLKNLRFGPFNSQLSLHIKWVMKIPRKHVFHTKTTWKTLKNMGDTNHFQSKQKEQKSFWFNPHMVEHTHIPLNIYNHTNEIDIHWTLDLCVVCVCIKCGIVFSLEWIFNDQFNQVIHN